MRHCAWVIGGSYCDFIKPTMGGIDWPLCKSIALPKVGVSIRALELSMVRPLDHDRLQLTGRDSRSWRVVIKLVTCVWASLTLLISKVPFKERTPVPLDLAASTMINHVRD